MDVCANCGTELPDHDPGTEREPCPRCGGVTREIHLTGSITARGSLAGGLDVQRGVNEARMGAFALIFALGVGKGLTVGFAASSVLFGALAGLLEAAVTAALLALIYRVPFMRHFVMDVMHRITGQ